MKEKNITKSKKVLLGLPFALLIFMSVVFLAGSGVLFSYAVASMIAFESTMIFLVLFASFMFALGFGLYSVHGILLYKKKYPVLLNKDSLIEIDNNPKPAKTVVSTQKKVDIKKIFSLPNISIFILFVGSIIAISSTTLDSIKAEAWVNNKASFMEQNGYYSEAQRFEISYSINLAEAESQIIDIETTSKNVVVIYDNLSPTLITIKGHNLFKNQIKVANRENKIILSDAPVPKFEDPLTNMFGFLFYENIVTAQIKIHIPKVYEGKITVNGEYILAKN